MWIQYASWALLLFTVGVSALPDARLVVKRDTKCNGYSEFCNRKYSNITYMGTHDSFAIGKLGSLGSNQAASLTDQMEDGIRLLQVQTHKNDNSDSSNPSGLNLCHTSCTLKNGGTLESYLKKVGIFLNNNKNEVITLVMTNPDKRPVTDFAKAFENANVKDLTYKPNSQKISKNDWPTLQQMINKNQRLVVFLDDKADFGQVNYILPEFRNIWENDFDQTTSKFNCTPSRYVGDTSTMMYMINHFLDKTIFTDKITSPDTNKIDQTNSVKSILGDANNCAKMHDSYPTFVLVDYYSSGNGSVFEAAAQMNNVDYKNKPLAASKDESNNKSAAMAFPDANWLGIALVFVSTIAWLS